MKFSQVIGLCLVAFTSLSLGAVVPAERIEERANKAKTTAKTTSTSTTKPTSSSTKTTSSSTHSTTTTSSPTTSATSAATSSTSSSSTTVVADAACTNGPSTRACWENGYSIATDFDQKFPTTGNTVTYNLEITNTTCNPDGYGSRMCMLINGQYPGPLIRASWGDTLVINVKNSLQDNGTSMHWHGVRQYHSPGYDGVGGISQCALAPGDSQTYTFQVTQFGTSWYHSHFSSQYGDGVVGPMIFDGPASANYDEDMGVYMVNDWYYQTATQVGIQASIDLGEGAKPANADNMLINGTNMNANGGGSYNKVSITSGKRYRLRLINISVDNVIRVSLDNHVLEIMSSDFIPVKPFYAETIMIGIGQRYDVVINANQTAGNYWFRADTATDCLSGNNGAGRAIWTYSGVSVATPTSEGYTEPSDCAEPSPLVPYWEQSVPSGSFQSSLQQMDINITAAVEAPNGDAIAVWALNTSSMDIAWDKPTLQYLMDGNTSYPTRYNVLPAVSEGGWNYWLVQQVQGVFPVPHPIHLHGHDFFVLGSGTALYSSSDVLNFANPPRRDTAVLPGGGWLAIAFNSNNPGAWLMHCHIAWHVSEGLAVQFLEDAAAITYPDETAFQNTCNNWDAYMAKAYYVKDDSGL